MTKVRHALTNAEYHAEGPNSVRVVDGDKWGRFDATARGSRGRFASAIRSCASGSRAYSSCKSGPTRLRNPRRMRK